ncbi:hypothetical protein JN853_11835 [Pseudomonas syringae pv. actinidiae ICMP 9853]|nr:hypothetical protein JN853_11835 [Pseudomonas syringae pv. actinidiae ICMP 9853]
MRADHILSGFYTLWAKDGPVRLARRPASHPPDQRQSSAVTYVALCVASAIAIKNAFMCSDYG